MEYQFNITISDNDYIAFNLFHTKYSPQGKNALRRIRNLSFGLILIIIALKVSADGLTLETGIYAVLLSLFVLLFFFAYKMLMGKLTALLVKSMQNTGKPPYDKEITFQFREDVFIDTVPSKRTEAGYELIEHIYSFKDRYLFIYVTSMSAHILPISQLKEQLDLEAFTAFLSAKSVKIENVK